MALMNSLGTSSRPKKLLIQPSANSPFCVSPSQLEEVTLDPDATNFSYLGLRSPGALTGGRTVKEIDEQLSSLKKENFNLKLRLYFLEERMGSNFDRGKEDVVQKNVELQVELANLQKDLDEKQELLCQAAKAMEIEEEEHGKEISVKNEEIESLKGAMEELHFQVEKLKREREHGNPMQTKRNSLERQTPEKETASVELREANYKLSECVKQIDSLKDELLKKSSIIDSLMTSNTEKDAELKDVKLQLQEVSSSYENLISEKNEIDAKVDKYKWQCCLTEKRNNELTTYVESLKERISSLEFQLENSKEELKQNVFNDSFTMKSDGRILASSTKSDKSCMGSTLHKNNCNGSCKESAEASSMSAEEVLELKKNHFKACKILKTMIQNKKDYVDQIEKLQKLVKEKGDEIQFLKRKIPEIMANNSQETSKKSIKDKVSELNLTAGWNPSSTKESLMDEDLTKQYKELVDELEKKIEILDETLHEKDAQIERLKSNVQEKENLIVDLQFELIAHVEGVNEQRSNDEKQDTSKEKLLEEKDEVIKNLEGELRKRTGDLQGIVNKELWEKNRTIEKLQIVIKGKEEAMRKIEKTNSNTELQLKILKRRINELGIHVNIPTELVSLDEAKEKDWEKSYHLVRAELEKSEKMRRDGQEICGILNGRLEELCRFLQSLLKHKLILGFLGQQQSHRLNEALNKSLEFSHALSSSILGDVDQSLQQLSNITNLLNSTRDDSFALGSFICDDDNSVLSIIPSDVTLTYRSHLICGNNDSDIVTVLREQITKLKDEVVVRDTELERLRNEFILKSESSNLAQLQTERSNSTSTTLKVQVLDSESESWSEPDRNVSLARIGLREESLRSQNDPRQMSTESVDDKKVYCKSPSKRNMLAESRQTIMSLHEQISELEVKLREKEEQLSAVQFTCNQSLKQEQDRVHILTSENSSLRNSLVEVGRQYENGQCEIKKLETELSQLGLEIKDTGAELEKVKVEKLQVEEQLNDLKVVVESLEEFKRNVHQSYDTKSKYMQNALNVMEIEKTALTETIKDLRGKLSQTTEHLQKTEADLLRVKNEFENCNKSYTTKLCDFKCELDQQATELRNVRDKESAIRKELEQKERNVINLTHHVEQLQTVNEGSSSKIAELEEKIEELLKRLDDVTLKNSELILEKTKLKNDNVALQTQVTIVKNEVADGQRLNQSEPIYKVHRFNLDQNNLSLQSQLNNQNTKYTFSSSLPNDLHLENPLVGAYVRQISDQSDYILDDMHDSRYKNVQGAIGDNERLHETSSPDLGIESDQGRFSSLENNAYLSRPLLPSIEISRTMNDMLDLHLCKNEGCSKQIEQIKNENVDLMKHLLRTRRALDDTVMRLTLANKQKKEVEKLICKEINKTSQVLRKAKANFDSGSET